MDRYLKVFSHPALHVRILSLISSCIVLIVGKIFGIYAPEGMYWGAIAGILFGVFFWLEIRGDLKSKNYFPVTMTQKFSYGVVFILYSVLIGCLLERYIPDFSSSSAGLWLGKTFHICIGFLIPFTCIQLLVLSVHLDRHGILERQVWKERQTGREGMVDLVGTVNRRLDPEGKVSLRGEIWTAVSETRIPIEVGSKVKVSRIEGLKVYVYPISSDPET
jgi:membrane protein implicated in regulation of membrane protease activity